MKYPQRISKLLRPKKKKICRVLDLYAGCGGLSLGFEANGFETIGYEMNQDACSTYNQNLHGICYNEILTHDTRLPKVDVLIAGPPCQPFSVLGNQLGLNDFRNGFPICVSAVKKIKPKVFLFENVRGLAYQNRWYLELVMQELKDLNYKVTVELLNAKDYDVPQNRERIFIVGTRKTGFSFPRKKKNIITAGDALGRLVYYAPKGSKFLNKSMHQYILKYEKASKCITNRDLHLDRPARTLTCRNLAGSTGDMHRLKLPNGRKRRLRIKEAARLQSFPEWFKFTGNETSVFNQIGNAVPPMMAFHIARCVKNYLQKAYKTI